GIGRGVDVADGQPGGRIVSAASCQKQKNRQLLHRRLAPIVRCARMRGLSVFFIFATACSPDGNASFTVRESVEQLQVTHARVGQPLSLLDHGGALVQSGVADEQGSYLFRKVVPADGYTIVAGAERSRHLTV